MQPQLIAGRYQVLRAIGHGGMGTVWLCRDQILGREVAVKHVGALPGESATETKRAMREARSAAALNHPNAVAVYDVVNHDGRPWLVMEYVEGQTLADEISHAGQLSPQRVADIGSQLAGALARAHERGIVHRDIKPGNVLIDKAGRPKISDFGIARGNGDEQLTQIGFLTGTPGYLSPELARGGDPHSASDVWALGATLYAAVEGQPPYEPNSNPIALLRTIATQPPRPMTHAGAVGPAIHQMMLEDPAGRWDMATSAQRLGRIARVESTAVLPRVDPAETAVMAARPLDPTQRLEAAAPVVAMAADRRTEGGGHRDLNVRAAMPSPVERRSGRRWLPLAFVALLLVGLGAAAYLLGPLGDKSSTTAAQGTRRATTPVRTTVPRTTPVRTTEPSATQAVTTPPAASTPTEVPKTTSSVSRNLESFVSSYYSNVTRDRESTWQELAPSMQTAAGGRHGYDGFWKTIARVTVNQTRSNPSAKSAVVSLTFTRKDGTTSTETHRLTFATDAGGYLIESDQLLS